MRAKHRLAAAILSLASLPCCGFAFANPLQCTIAAFEASASSVLEACAVTLRQPDLSKKGRVEALKIRGLAFHRLKQLDAAAIEYEHAMTLDPGDSEIAVLRGRVAYYKSNLLHAMTLAEQAARLDPNSAGAYDLMGSVLRWIGQFDPSRAAYEKAIELAPSEPLYRYHLLEFFKGTKQQREALAQADSLLTLPETTISLPFGIGYEDIRTSFKTATRLERARLLTSMGRFPEAEQAFDEVIRDAPSALSYTLRGQFRAKRDAPIDQVVADLNQARTIDPDFWLLYDVLGRVYFFAGRYEEAAEAFRREAEIKPHGGQARWWRAMSLRGARRLEEAKVEVAAAVDVDAEKQGKGTASARVPPVNRPAQTDAGSSPRCGSRMHDRPTMLVRP